MQSQKQNKPKRKRISSTDQPSPLMEKSSTLNEDKVVIGKMVYEKVGLTKAKRK
jgi:hypothetical protein